MLPHKHLFIGIRCDNDNYYCQRTNHVHLCIEDCPIYSTVLAVFTLLSLEIFLNRMKAIIQYAIIGLKYHTQSCGPNGKQTSP